MGEQNTNTEYRLADIEKYLKGEMNAREMHDIELAALQDPFLSDAIEGYNAASLQKSYAHLNEIEAMLTGQKEQARVIAMPEKKRGWINIAAGVILLAGAGTAFWLLSGKNSESAKVTIQQEAVAANAPAQVGPADTVKPLAQATPLQKAVKEYKAVNDAAKSKKAVTNDGLVATNVTRDDVISPSAPRIKANDTISSNYGYYQDVAKADDHLSTNLNKDYFLNDSTKTVANAIAGRANGLIVNKAMDNNLYSNAASPKGPLTQNTQLNKPFAGNTDKYFDVKPDSVQPEGFAANFKAKNRTEQLKKVAPASSNAPITNLQVTLTPSPSFDTVAVTYLNNKNYSRKLVADSSLFPQGGWESFRDYVYRKLHKEIDTTDALTYGDVEVEFTVDNLGNARNLKVTKSLNKQSDEQALDLVRQWPGWIAAKKNKKGKVVIQF